MDSLIAWLIFRLQIIYGFLVNTLNLPVPVAFVLATGFVLLFFYCLYDLIMYRNKGEITFVWLLIVAVVPFSTLLYLAFGRKAVRNAPIHNPSVVNGKRLNTSVPQKRYFLGATTALGGAIAAIALVIGLIGLGFFILIIIAYIQCMNDPKCM